MPTFGPIGMVHKGEYEAGATYAPLNIVTWGGGSYLYRALTAGSGHPLPVAPETSTAYWALLAARGQDLSLRLTATHIQWRVGGGEWADLMSIETMTEASARAVQAASEAAESEAAAEAAQGAAQAAKTGAEAARDAAATAKTGAEGARSAAETAKTAAETARTDAQAARDAAQTAKTDAQAASGAAVTARTDAQAARDAAQSAQTGAQTAKADAEAARDEARDKVSSITGMTVSASTLAPGAPATAVVELIGGVLALALGIPEGKKGIDGTGAGDMLSDDYGPSGTKTVARADKLTTPRAIAISGGATGTATQFDGSGNISIPVTALDVSKATAGTLPVARGGTGVTTAAAALAGLGGVPTTRTINNKPLSANVTLTASDVNAATRYTYTVTIPASWTGTEAPYTQTVAVAGMLATDTPVADLVQSNDWAEATAQREEYGKITRMTTGAGVLTVYATEPTTVALTVALEGVR